MRQIPRLIAVLKDGLAEQQVKAAEGLADLAHNGITGPWAASACREAIGRQDGIQLLVQRLRGPPPELSQQAARALANLTCDNPSNVAAVVQCGGITQLAELLEHGTIEIKAKVAGVLHNLTFDSPANRLVVVQARVVPALVHLLGSASSDTAKVQAAAALGVLSQGAQMGSALAEPIGEGIPAMVALMKSRSVSPTAKDHVIRLLMNVVFENQSNPSSFISSAGLPQLATLLTTGPCSQSGKRNCVHLLRGFASRHPEARLSIATALGVEPDNIETELSRHETPFNTAAALSRASAAPTAAAPAPRHILQGRSVPV